MPQLPSGLLVAIMPTPLGKLFKEGGHFGNIHKVLDVYRYFDVLYLVPEGEAGSQAGVPGLHADSLPVPPGMAFVPAGFKLSEWEERSCWSEADLAAFREFLAGRGGLVLREWLDAWKTKQAKLREAEAPLTRLLVAWWDAGLQMFPSSSVAWYVLMCVIARPMSVFSAFQIAGRIMSNASSMGS